MFLFLKKYALSVAIVASIVAYVFLGYFVERENFATLFFWHAVSFISFFVLLQNDKISDKQLFSLGLVFRILFVFGIPFWSQDFYRFIWDGRLLASGSNPFVFLPNEIIATTNIAQATEIYNGMGSLSAQHFSNYPPLNQVLFATAALFSKNSIFFSAFIFKLLIILADVGVYYYGRKVLKEVGQNSKKIFWYFLNPLVLLELTGNLHFEGIMLCFFIIGMYYFFIDKWKMAALFIGLSIATKLLPLLLLPFFYQKLGFKKSIIFYTIVIGLNVLLFLPFFTTTLVGNYTETIGLWFTNFEFNASIYYVIREVGFWIKGYNIIGIVGQITPILTVLLMCSMALFLNNRTPKALLSNMLLALAIYFFIATTVHSWYVINLLILSIFTRYKFPLVWSFAVVLSYFAYSVKDYKENFYLLFLEYLLVFGVFFFEVFSTKKNVNHEK